MVSQQSTRATQPPQQGQVLKLDLDPTLGHEQKGYCPVLVTSATAFNHHTGFCWVVPITSQQKGMPSEVNLPQNLPIHGTLLLSQMRAIDWRARPFTVACAVPPLFLADMNARLACVLEPERDAQ